MQNSSLTSWLEAKISLVYLESVRIISRNECKHTCNHNNSVLEKDLESSSELFLCSGKQINDRSTLLIVVVASCVFWMNTLLLLCLFSPGFQQYLDAFWFILQRMAEISCLTSHTSILLSSNLMRFHLVLRFQNYSVSFLVVTKAEGDCNKLPLKSAEEATA